MIINKNYLLILVLCLLTLLAAMNSVIFNVAIPDISKELSLNSSQVSWISVGYTSIIAVGSLAYGQLSMKYPIKKLFNFGIILFCMGSVVGFFGYKEYLFVLIGRFIQASGSSSFVTLSMLTINKYIPFKLRGVSLSLLSISIALALGVGPLLGGVITSNYSWHFLFLVMLISMLIPIFLKPLLSTSEKDGSIEFDYFGMLLTFLLIISIMLSVNSYYVIVIASIIISAILIKYSKSRKDSFINLNIFSDGLFKRLISMGFLLNACHLAILFVIPLLLSAQFSMNSQEIGGVFFLGCMVSVFSSFLAKKMLENKKALFVLFTSNLFILLGSLGLSLFWNQGITLITVLFLLICFGYSPIQVVLNSLVSEYLSEKNSGTGLGIYNMFNFIGMAFGPALVSKVNFLFNSYSITFFVCLCFVFTNLLCVFSIKSKI
ncbi:MFS transporter [Enterococcus faecalis]